MKKIKPTHNDILDRWEKVVQAVMMAHYTDGMTVDDFMSMHTKAPKAIVEEVIDRLIQTSKVDEVV